MKQLNDHLFGNVYFEKAYRNLDDSEVPKEQKAFQEFVELCKERNLFMPPFKPIKEGGVIDLGGLTFDIISLPGTSAWWNLSFP